MSIIQKLTESFLKFPGIGPRQARRFVDFLIKQDIKDVEKLSENILELKKTAKQCQHCGYHFIPSTTSDVVVKCDICRNVRRDKNSLLIVEKDIDLENIEKAGVYNGKYFILGATINSLNNSAPAKKRFEQLFNLVKNNDSIKEIILATSATTEGETTAVYLSRVLEPLVKKQNIKISRLGRGLSTGTELEYSDSETLKNALENRK